MPLKMKKSMRKPRRQYRRKGMPRPYIRGGHIREQASAQYSTLSAPLNANASVYAFRNFSLAAASVRVQNVGKSYQEYRIKRVTWEVRPCYDTFQAPASGNAATVPHLYWRVDKLATYDVDTTLQTLKASGCKPIRLDDKTIRKSFKPAVVVPVVQGPALPDGSPDTIIGSYRTSPWLATNNAAYTGSSQTGWVASSVDHQGLLIAIDQDTLSSSAYPQAFISFTVEFEFRKPLDDISSDGATMQDVKLETLAPQYVPPSETSALKVE